jgi:hypothetical protein
MATITANILVAKKSDVESRLVQLVKKCAKKGFTAPTWTFGNTYKSEEGMRIALTVENATPCYGGWTFVAALTHIEDETVVRAAPGEQCPQNFRATGPVCEHCGHNRARKETYVVRHEDGSHKQVGSTCLADFTGCRDAVSVINQAGMWRELSDIMDDGSSCGHRVFDCLEDYLLWVAACIRLFGWMSKGKAELENVQSTCNQAYMVYSAPDKSKFDVTVIAEDHETVAHTLEWVLSVDADNDYMMNLQAIARVGYFTPKTMGLAASMIAACNAAEARVREDAARKVSQYVGTPKKRQNFVAKLSYVSGYSTQYGYTTVLGFTTQEGNVLVWKSTSDTGLGKADVSKTYNITGTVKEHEEFRGVKQTVILRCKLAEVA